jgi:NAD(P)-dependent dehydrogenase (short-subunit alcohol dehydrogenase family)
MTLAGKKVVVIGGSSGIGLATAELAKRQGADVIIASRSAAKLDPIAERLSVTAIPTDVTSDQSVADLFRRTGPVSC